MRIAGRLGAAHGAGLLVAAIATGSACAQERFAPTASTALEEIVVTARRREEPLQRVPVAVTALDQDQLDASRMTELSDVQHAAPTLVIWPILGNPVTATMSLRGLAEPDLLPTNDPTVGLYLDGVYIARMTGANLRLVDTARVEVLRGPQGTLFGRNTIGGAINIVSNKPTMEPELAVSAQLGNYGLAEIAGVVNAPIHTIDGAVRVTVLHTAHGGYGRAITLQRDLSDDDTNFIRAQLELQPSERWTLNVTGDVTDADTSSQLVTFVAAFPPTATQIPAAAGHPEDDLKNYAGVTDGQVLSNRAGQFDARVRGLSATLTGRFAPFQFISMSAYRDLDVEIDATDYDGTPYDLGAVVLRTQAERQLSQEFQLQGQAIDNRLVWTAGAHFFTERASLYGHNVALAPLASSEGVTSGTAYNASASAYGHLTWEVTPALRVTGGLRYNVDDRQLVSENARINNGVATCRLDESLLDDPAVCRATLPVKRYRYAPAQIGIDYSPAPKILLYGKISRGYRAGGYNMRGGTPTGLLAFEPEELVSYEIGSKSDVLDDRLRLDLALYDAEYRDVQLGAALPDPSGGVVFIKQNGGRGRLRGGELEASGLLGRLRLMGAIGITHGRFTHLDSTVVSVTDDTPLGLPEKTYRLGADLPLASRLGGVGLHADYAWRSSDADDVFLSRCACDNAYGLLTASATLELDRRNLTLGVWGRNLADTHYMANWVDFDDYIDAIPGEPRTYGVTLRYDFR